MIAFQLIRLVVQIAQTTLYVESEIREENHKDFNLAPEDIQKLDFVDIYLECLFTGFVLYYFIAVARKNKTLEDHMNVMDADQSLFLTTAIQTGA